MRGQDHEAAQGEGPGSFLRAPGTLRDAALLRIFLLVLLFGPYLPQTGLFSCRFRLDHLLVPLLALFFLGRGLRRKDLCLPEWIGRYFLFFLWLGLVTLFLLFFHPTEVDWPSLTLLLAGVDAYARPLLFLFIASQARLDIEEVKGLVRIVLWAGVPFTLIAALQLMPATAGWAERFVLLFYNISQDNSSIQGGLKAGRAMSIFIQVSTFGMFNLLALGLLLAELLGAEIVASSRHRWILLGTILLGGICSGSKVFTGGLVLLAALFLFCTPILKRFLRRKIVFGLLIVFCCLGLFLPRLYSPDRYEKMKTGLLARLDPSRIYEIYLASRFRTEGAGEVGKIFRGEGIGILKDHPWRGQGFPVVVHTTDSFFLGMLMMGGIVGFSLFVFFILSVLRNLYSASRKSPAPVAAMARALVFLLVAFLAAAVGFHTLIQDRAGDAYWLITGLVLMRHLRGERAAPARSSFEALRMAPKSV
ncbi:MAG: hypothetical protein V1918_08665 [Planctomycetota bacterium]